MRIRVALMAAVLHALLVPRAHALAPMHPDLEAELRARGAYRAVAQQLAAARARGAIDAGLRAEGPLVRAEPGKKAVWKAIIILVDFSDQPATGLYDSADFSDMLVSTGTWPTGSMRDHYLESSYGKFSFHGDVVGWYRMPQPYSYYCNQDGNPGTNDDYGYGAYPNNAQKLYEDAVAAADVDVNFQDYRNGNATVEGVFIVHSGPGAETTGNASDIWSHRSTGSVSTQDGVSCSSYTHQPELQGGGMSTMGVFAHEFGHSLGLPDLYDTDDSSSGIGRWCMMAGGTWNGGGRTPAHFSAWCKRFLGWAVATDVTTATPGLVMTSATAQDDQIRLQGDGHIGSEYLLLEVRRRTGFDAALPGEGLLVWHVDESVGGNQNEVCEPPASLHPLVRLIQADGACALEAGTSSGNAGDPYPGSTANLVLGALTTPNSRAYSGRKSGIRLENIVDLGSSVQLDVEVNEILQLNVPGEYPTLDDAVALAGKDDDVRIEAGHSSLGDWRVLDGFSISGGWDPTYSTQDPLNPSLVEGTGGLQAIFDADGAATPLRLDNLIVRNGGGERWYTPDAWKGGAVAMTGGSFVATRTRFENNQAGPNTTLPSLGGALAFENTDVTLQDCVFDGNLAQEGGAIHVEGGSLTLERTTFLNHVGLVPPVAFEQRGGAILAESASVDDTDGVYRFNTAADGGAIYVSGGAASFTGTRVESNTGTDDGAGIYLLNSDLTADGMELTSNQSSGEGGGLYADGGVFDVRRARVIGNDSGTLGGGLYLANAQPGSRVGSSVLSGNTAAIIVGALLVSGGEMTVEQNTFHGNVGQVATGGLQSTGASVWIRNNVFAGHTGAAYTLAGGTLHQLDYNCWWQTTGAPDVSGTLKGVNSTSRDPALVDPLAGDFHLGAGSAAIDRGDPLLPSDFDGSRSDIGAYGGIDGGADRPTGPVGASWQDQGSDTQIDWAYPGQGTAPVESHIFWDVLAPVGKEPLGLFAGTLAVVPAPTTTYLHTGSNGESYQVQLVDADGHAGSYSPILNAPPTATPPQLPFSVGEPAPNPFNPSTTIALTLPTTAAVRAEVYDLAGRRVRVLLDRTLSAGTHTVEWNGRDQRDRAVASGSYLFRLSSTAGDATRRLLLIK